jgi:histidinol dehydrogenase
MTPSSRRRQILADVKARGDAAVLEYTNRFDRLTAAPPAWRRWTSQEELQAALAAIPEAQRRRWKSPRSACAPSTSARSRN